MKRANRKFILIIAILSVFLFVGCSKFNFDIFNGSEEEKEKTSQVTDVPDNEAEDSVETGEDDKASEETDDTELNVNVTSDSSPEDNSDNSTPTPSAIQPSANIELPIFNVNADGEIQPVTALVQEDSKITPELIVETVVESLADQSIIIGIKDVTGQDDAIIVNFDKDKTPYNNMGSGYEASILDAIAQSLIDNLDDYNKVIYHVNDGPYVSGVYEYELYEPHFER